MDIIKSLKKGFSVLTLMALSLTLLSGVSVAKSVDTFSDASSIPGYARDAVQSLMDQGVLQGNDNDNTFAPARTLNRAEVAKVLVLATGAGIDTAGGPSYSDVDSSHWFYDYVETATNMSWVQGYADGSYGSLTEINRVELAKMVVEAFELDYDTAGGPHFKDVAESDWFYPYVETAYNNGLMLGYGDGTFGPSNTVNRAETAKIVYDAQLTAIGPVGPAEGTLEISLSSNTPARTNIPYNATSVPFTTVSLTAADDSDVEVSSLTFTRLGLGNKDTFKQVWLEIEGFKVGNNRSITNKDTVDLVFNPPIVVEAGETLEADFVASMKIVAGGDSFNQSINQSNSFSLVRADAIASSAVNVVGDFPVQGEEMVIANYKVTELAFDTLGSDTTVNVGDNYVEIGKFRLENQSETNKDVEFRAVTFKNDGTATVRDILENVVLYSDDERVSAETIISGDYVTFRLDNGVTGGYILEDGLSKIFSIRADIVAGEKSDFINFRIRDYQDIVAVEVGTAFGSRAISASDNGILLADGGSTEVSTNACVVSDSGAFSLREEAENDCARLRAYLIDAGDVNVSRDPSSIGNQDYAPGTNNATILTARVLVAQPIYVDGVSIKVTDGTIIAPGATALGGTGTDGSGTISELNAQFKNFRLYLNDRLLDSTNNFDGLPTADASSGVLNYDTSFDISGTSVIKVIANIENSAQSGTKLRLQLNATDFTSPEYISTGDQISADQLLGVAPGSFINVVLSELRIARTDGLSDGEVAVAGVDEEMMLRFAVNNNDAGDIRITSLSVAAVATGSSRSVKNFDVAVFVDGVQEGNKKAIIPGTGSVNLPEDDPDAGDIPTQGVVTFNDLGVVVPSSGQKELTLYVDTIEESGFPVKGQDESAAAPIGNITSVNVGTENVAKILVGDSLNLTEEATGSVGVLALGATTLTIAETVAIGDKIRLEEAVVEASTATSPGAAAVGSVTLTGGDAGDSYQIVIGGVSEPVVPFNTDLDTTAEDIISGLGVLIGTNTSFSATRIGTVITITADNVGVGGNLPIAVNYIDGGGDAPSAVAVGASGGADPFSAVSASGGTEIVTAESAGTGPITISATNNAYAGTGTYTILEAGQAGENVEVLTVDTASGVVTFAATTDDFTPGTVNYSLKHTIQLVVTDIQADNIETGNEIDFGTDDIIAGATFELVRSGKLTVSIDSKVSSDILVANSRNIEILKINLAAQDDDVLIEQLFLVNDFADVDGGNIRGRLSFSLYNEAGQLISNDGQAVESGNKIEFKLGTDNRIVVPKNQSTYISLRANVLDINQDNQTGRRIRIGLDQATTDSNAIGSTGFAKVTTKATSINLNEDEIFGDFESQGFVAYRSSIEVRHADFQSDKASTTGNAYYFTVSADSAYEVELGQVTLAFASEDTTGASSAQAFRTKDDGQLTDLDIEFSIGGNPIGGVDVDNGDPFIIDLSGEKLSAGESRNYVIEFDLFDLDPADSAGFSFEILRDNAYAVPTDLATQIVVPNNLVWSDRSAKSHTINSNDWLNGYLVDVDTISYTLTRQG